MQSRAACREEQPARAPSGAFRSRVTRRRHQRAEAALHSERPPARPCEGLLRMGAGETGEHHHVYNTVYDTLLRIITSTIGKQVGNDTASVA